MTGKRNKTVQPFHVMDILARAKALEALGMDIIHLEVGEPDFPTPNLIKQAGIKAIEQGNTFYTPALGLPELREIISDHYQRQFNVSVNPQRIAVTSGASAALLMILGTLLDPQDELILTDPGYPCNSNFSRFLTTKLHTIIVTAENGYQPTIDQIKQNWHPDTKVLLLASPSNPSGTIINRDELSKIYHWVKEKKAFLIVDEIYHQLVYDFKPQTALAISDDIIIINSFSKYFQMTGWRLGWCVLPEKLISTFEKLAQNIYLSPPTISQYAALAAFDQKTLELLEQRKAILKARRDYLYENLIQLGFKLSAKPQGAFYIYADCSAFSKNAMKFSYDILQQAGIAVTPGKDFGTHRSEQHIRFSYTQDISILEQAIKRLKIFLKDYREA